MLKLDRYLCTDIPIRTPSLMASPFEAPFRANPTNLRKMLDEVVEALAQRWSSPMVDALWLAPLSRSAVHHDKACIHGHLNVGNYTHTHPHTHTTNEVAVILVSKQMTS